MSSWTKDGHNYTQHGNQIQLDDRKVGWITMLSDGTRIFVSPRDPAKHFFRIWQGWGLSEALFKFLKDTVQTQEIHLKIGRFLILISKMEDWEQHSIPYQKEPFEKQIVLPERFMKRVQMTMAQMLG